MYIGNLVSAASWYADVAVAAFLLLFVLAGALRGFGKSTKGFFVFVFVVCISLLLTGMTQTAAVEGSLGKSISEGIGSASEGWGVAFNSPVYTDDGENYSILVNDELVPLGGSDFGVKGSLAAFIAKSFHVEDGQSVGIERRFDLFAAQTQLQVGHRIGRRLFGIDPGGRRRCRTGRTGLELRLHVVEQRLQRVDGDALHVGDVAQRVGFGHRFDGLFEEFDP